MNFLPFSLLIVIICCNRLPCNTVTSTENVRAIRRSLGMSTMRSDESHTEGKEMSWKDGLLTRKIPLNAEELKTMANAGVGSSNRKNRIFGSLAIPADLTNVASSITKTYVNSSPLHLSPDLSRLSPHIAAIYDPHVYVPHPYVLATPLGFYPLLNLLRPQPIGGVQNDFQALTQNPQLSNILESKKPIDLLNNNDKYIEETKRFENVNNPSSVQEEADESVGLQVENVRNAEEKETLETACDTQKRYNKKQNNPKLVEAENKDKASRLFYMMPHANHLTSANATAEENNTSTTNATQNSTMNMTETVTPPFDGYYGGYPQNVNHIDFTTEAHHLKHHDYDQVHYNLPSYDKPVNFYSDDKYNYYSHSTGDSFPTNEFQQDPIPEFLSSDFNRFLYTPENTPPFVNSGFRPVA